MTVFPLLQSFMPALSYHQLCSFTRDYKKVGDFLPGPIAIGQEVTVLS